MSTRFNTLQHLYHRDPVFAGLTYGNAIMFGKKAVHNGWWFVRVDDNYEQVGFGDLAPDDLTKIADALEEGEEWLILEEIPLSDYPALYRQAGQNQCILPKEVADKLGYIRILPGEVVML